MTNPENPEVSRLLVGFLRLFANVTQAEFGEASGIDQSDVSRLESGAEVPSERMIRRMAKAAKVPWFLAALLRRFLETFVAAVARRRGAVSSEPLDLGVLEPALMAAEAYLLEEKAAPPRRQPPEEALREAETFWTELEEDTIPERRRLIELTVRGARSWALALRIAEASREAAAHDVEEALELAELALSIAERVPGAQSLGIQGHCWAHIAYARRAANDASGSDAAFARSWDLWRAAADACGEPLPEPPVHDLEGFLKAGRVAVLRSAGAV
jgi:transcriptional regulator with XRE-family HTH domain